MQLIKNPRFVKEYEEFSNKIERLSDENIKKEMKQLLNQLVAAVKSIDREHGDIVLVKKLPQAVGEHKHTISEIRKKIVHKLMECEKSNLIR